MRTIHHRRLPLTDMHSRRCGHCSGAAFLLLMLRLMAEADAPAQTVCRRCSAGPQAGGPSTCARAAGGAWSQDECCRVAGKRGGEQEAIPKEKDRSCSCTNRMPASFRLDGEKRGPRVSTSGWRCHGEISLSDFGTDWLSHLGETQSSSAIHNVTSH